MPRHVRELSKLAAALPFFGFHSVPGIYTSFLSFVLLSFCVCVPFSSAQVSAKLSGVVADQSGASVPGAKVTVKNLDTGFSRGALTDQSGRYMFFALPVGAYEIMDEGGIRRASSIG